MIENIASELIREELNFPSYDEALAVAEHVLNRIEKAGMLPPFQVGSISYGMNDKNMHNTVWFHWDTEEPEDE